MAQTVASTLGSSLNGHSALHPELALDDEQDHRLAKSDKERVAELDKLFGYHDHKHWTGLTLADLVRQVEEGWDEPYE